MTDTSWIEIDLDRLDENLAAIRQRVGPGVKVCGVVKADAYGLGAGPIATRLANRGIDMLAVYSPDQAAELVKRNIRCPLLILMPLRHLDRTDPIYDTAVGGRLHLTVQDEEHLLQIDELGQSIGRPLPVHLHVDTGMSRAGLNREQLARVIDRCRRYHCIHLAGLYTHFAAADDDTKSADQQMELLERTLKTHGDALSEDVVVHAANTFATHRDTRFHRSMVRVGLGLFGYGPELMSGGPNPSDPPRLQPVMRWLSRIVHVQRYPRGSMVGYNHTYRLTRDSLLGVVAAGYADGYPLALGNRAVVGLVNDSGHRVIAPVRGKVNMDQIIIDLTEVPREAARVGTLVELVSWDTDSPCALPTLSELGNSNCYEMLCRLSSHLPRRYVGSGSSDRWVRTRPAT